MFIADLGYISPLPEYMNPPTAYVVQCDPQRYDEEDAILHISYNVLLPQEIEQYKRSLALWINSSDGAFPLNVEEVLYIRSFAKLSASSALSGLFASKILEYITNGMSVEIAIEQTFLYIEHEIAPRYLQKAELVANLESTAQDLVIQSQYKLLKEALISSGKNPRGALEIYKNRISTYKTNKEMLNMLLAGAIGRNPIDSAAPSPLRPSDYWQQRRKALFQAIDKVLQLAPNAPFILGLQEITSSMLPDFKKSFEGKGARVISYNMETGKNAEEPLAENEKAFKEALSLTIIVSKEFEILRQGIEELPNTSGVKRRILGIEVMNKKSGKQLAVFTTHTDHIPSERLYKETAAKIHEFVVQFLKDSGNPDLPFIFSGDLNTFPDRIETISFINSLRSQGPFKNSRDYREGTSFHSPEQIAKSTFIGQPIDDFKTLIKDEGGILAKVLPNALDHTYASSQFKVRWGMRDAAVYDGSGDYVDPYKNSELFIKYLKERQTASDHFMNAVLLTDKS